MSVNRAGIFIGLVGENKIKLQTRSFELKNLIITFYTLFIFVYFFAGVSSRSTNAILLLLTLMWYVLTFVLDFNTFLKVFNSFFWLFYLFFLAFITVFSLLLFSPPEEIYKAIGQYLIFFLPFTVFLYYREVEDKQYIRMLTVGLIIAITVIIFMALSFYSRHEENVARALASNPYRYGKIAIGGGYGLAYACLIIFILCLDWLLKRHIRKLVFNIFLILLAVLSLMVVVETKSTITLITLVFGTGAVIFLNLIKKRRSPVAIILTSVLLIGMAVFLIYSKDIGTYIAQSTAGAKDIVIKRFHEIGVTLSGDATTGDNLDAVARGNAIMLSIRTFLENPLIGVGSSYAFLFPTTAVTGNHSEIFDSLAKFGLIGGVPYFAMVYCIFKEEFKSIKKRLSIAFVLALIFLAFLNPIFIIQLHIVLLFLVPASIMCLGDDTVL